MFNMLFIWLNQFSEIEASDLITYGFPAFFVGFSRCPRLLTEIEYFDKNVDASMVVL